MVRWTERRRAFLAEKFGDLANFAVAALVFGQAVGQDELSVPVGLAGIATWAVFMVIGVALSGGSR
jgi:hypothetical protein